MIKLAPLPSMVEQLQEDLQKKRDLEDTARQRILNEKGQESSGRRCCSSDNNIYQRATTSCDIKGTKTESKTEQAAQVARDRAVYACFLTAQYDQVENDLPGLCMKIA
jgi:hypothetical protein